MPKGLKENKERPWSGNRNKHESRFVYPNTGKCSDFVSHAGRSYHHSGRGTQYTNESYHQFIQEHHIHQSMSRAGRRCAMIMHVVRVCGPE